MNNSFFSIGNICAILIPDINVWVEAVGMKKVKLVYLATGIFLATSFIEVNMVQAEPHEPSLAITATALPVEEPEKKVEESADSKQSMKSRVDAILHEDDVQKAVVKVNGVKKGNLYIPKDTQIMLSLQEGLNSRKVKEGANFRLMTVDDLVINDVVVIPKGREVMGKVLEARGNRAFGGAGKLELHIPYVETLNGLQIPVHGYINSRGDSDGGAVAVGAVVSLVGGLFMKGKNIEYVPGQLFCVTVQDDTDLDATPDNLAEVMSVDRTRMQSITVKAAE